MRLFKRSHSKSSLVVETDEAAADQTPPAAATAAAPSPATGANEEGTKEKSSPVSLSCSDTNSQSRNKRSGTHKPVDLDELYDGKYVASDDSDASVGDVTETSVSNSASNSHGEHMSAGPQEDKRMSALVHTMAEKQQGISETFCHMIEKMTKMMQSMEEQIVLEDDHDNKNTEKSKAKAHRNVQKALEMQENAFAMQKKQQRIAQQLETLVHRLELESLDIVAHNQSLKRQLQMAKVLLKDEAGVEMEDISETASGSYARHSSSSRRTRHNSKRPPLSRSKGSSPSVRSSHSSPADMMMHPIKEIAFSNTVVDVAEMMTLQESAAAAATTTEDAADPLVVGAMQPSPHSDSPASKKTAATTTTSSSVASETLRFIL